MAARQLVDRACPSGASGHAHIARIVAATWGAHPSLERAVERAGIARWQRVEDDFALRALTAAGRPHGGSIEVARSGGIRLRLASEAPPRALADPPEVAVLDAGAPCEPIDDGRHEQAAFEEPPAV